ncbi:metallophosphoesterase [Agarivorans litoreus]|uniref:metallophosphoesterase n=1 Tax=Agarivorans litoreus TaxID=1510455 RepID=UPI001C7D390C|nr:metallophosphoesterase [Agarivorans litoreus]
MALILPKYIDTLFADLKQYGLRGNSALWEQLKVALKESEQAFTAQGLIEWVHSYAHHAISQAIIAELSAGQVNSMNQRVLSEYGYHARIEPKDKQQDIKQNGATDWLSDFVETLLTNHDTENDIYVEAFNQGGMSGGGFSLSCWKQDMLPELKLRCYQLEAGLQFREKNAIENLLFIGDVHGQPEKLDALLTHSSWDKDDTKLVFVGDLIDNAPESGVDHLALLNQVKSYVDNNQAYCLLGNHEFNAIGWLLQNDDGSYCRDRSNPGNIKQHQLFLEQIGEGSAEHYKWIEWFKSLPLFLNFGDITAIHACWHLPSLAKLRPYLNEDNSLKSEHWVEAFDKDHELYQLIEILLKGPEIQLPEGQFFLDKNAIERFDIRVAWWKHEYSVGSYQELAVVPSSQRHLIPNVPLARGSRKYNIAPIFPVVIGHYTLDPSPFPEALSEQVVCVDFNAAKQAHPLVGFFVNCDSWWDSPSELTECGGFVCVNEIHAATLVNEGVGCMLSACLTPSGHLVKSKQFEQEVAEALLIRWDPIGIYDPDDDDQELADEYGAYEAAVNQLAQSKDLNKLAAYLFLVERHVIGIEREGAERECAKIAHYLVDSWQSYLSRQVQDDFF